MVDILVDDHHQISALCDRLRESLADASAASAIAEVLVAMLSRHLSVEEQYLYPTARSVLRDGEHLAAQELAEDAEMLLTLKQLHGSAPDDPAYATLVATVSRQHRRHAMRASEEIFPRLRARCSENELIRLGNRVEIAHEAAPTRPHPATPVTPPVNKVLDPAVGVVDKVRDIIAGRTTWPEDL
nr:hemerythrin domain-containing protein [Planosporangium mesophilum]